MKDQFEQTHTKIDSNKMESVKFEKETGKRFSDAFEKLSIH